MKRKLNLKYRFFYSLVYILVIDPLFEFILIIKFITIKILAKSTGCKVSQIDSHLVLPCIRLWPWANCLLSISAAFFFLICKMEIRLLAIIKKVLLVIHNMNISCESALFIECLHIIIFPKSETKTLKPEYSLFKYKTLSLSCL